MSEAVTIEVTPEMLGRIDRLPVMDWDPTPTILDAIEGARPIRVSDWVRANRIYPDGSKPEQYYDIDYIPYMRAPLDDWGDPACKQITLWCSTQVGKSATLEVMAGWSAARRPGGLMWVMPSEKACRDFSQDRLTHMFKHSPALQPQLGSGRRDTKQLQLRLKRMNIDFAWATSPAELASKAKKYNLLDEIDKYPRFSGKEAAPEKLAKERGRTHFDYKEAAASTGTTADGPICRRYRASDERKYHVPCQQCGHYQILVFENIRWSKVPDGLHGPEAADWLEQGNGKVWYNCPNCEHHIADHEKPAMNEAGVWVPKSCHLDGDGLDGDVTIVYPADHVPSRHHGYHIWAAYSPWLRWRDIAVEFLRSKDDEADYMNFVNSWLADVWENKVASLDSANAGALKAPYSSDELPEEATLVTATVDVQIDHVYVRVRAWADSGESWGIYHTVIRQEEGLPSEFEALANELFTHEWFTRSGRSMPTHLALIDSRYRTNEVYDFCETWWPRAVPTKGAGTAMQTPYKLSPAKAKPKKGKPPKRTLADMHVVTFDSHYYKDQLARHIAGTASQAWHIEHDVGADYIKQLYSEEKVQDGTDNMGSPKYAWVKRRGHRDNHYWDTEVLQMLAADLRSVGRKPQPGAGPRSQGRKKPKRGGWGGASGGIKTKY